VGIAPLLAGAAVQRDGGGAPTSRLRDEVVRHILVVVVPLRTISRSACSIQAHQPDLKSTAGDAGGWRAAC